MDNARPWYSKAATGAAHCWSDAEAQLPCVVGGHHHAMSPHIYYCQSHTVIDGKCYQCLTAITPKQVPKVSHLVSPTWQCRLLAGCFYRYFFSTAPSRPSSLSAALASPAHHSAISSLALLVTSSIGMACERLPSPGIPADWAVGGPTMVIVAAFKGEATISPIQISSY